MTFLSLFSGIGGLDLGLERSGMRCIGQVEIDPFCRRVLAKHWPDVPRFEDVRTFNAGMLQEQPDLICGGFPCQDISHAGKKVGIRGERSGLWTEIARLVCEIRPAYVFVENVSALLGRGLGTVLSDMACVGYDAEWDCLPASAVGAPHRRERIWVVAYPSRSRSCREGQGNEDARVGFAGGGERFARAESSRVFSDADSESLGRIAESRGQRGEWATEPDVGRVANGIPARVDRLRGLGNAVVPQVAEFIGRRIMEAA